jgi:DNA-binding response OmpR family regulator
MQMLQKVLLIEDDHGIAGALSQALQNTYDIDIAATGELGLYKTDTRHYDVIVLDLSLPDMPGATVCRQLREEGISAPILILTAESGIMTKITLLDSGANDYLTKPFSLGELKARLRALTRVNHQPVRQANQLKISGILLDRRTYEVSRDGVTVSLRRKEFMLLECLMEHAGSVVTRRTLTRRAWQGSEELWTNTVDVHIKYLRDKLDRPFARPLIKTVHGLGYKLELSLSPTTKSPATVG